MRHQRMEIRTRPVFERNSRLTYVDEAGSTLIRGKPEFLAHARIIRAPFGDPVRHIAKGIRREHKRHAAGARRQLLFPFRNGKAFAHPADHGNDERRTQEPFTFNAQPFLVGFGVLRCQAGGEDFSNLARASFSKRMKRHGVSLP